MTPFMTFLIFTAAVAGAFFYRARGGGLMTLPRPAEQVLFCIVFGVCMDALGVPLWWQLGAFVLAVLAVLSGHGQYFFKKFQLSNMEAIKPERLDFLLLPFFGRDPRTEGKYAKWRGFDPTQEPEEYGMTVENWKQDMGILLDDIYAYGTHRLFWRCVAGFSVTGGFVALAPGLAIILTTPHIGAGLAVAASGFLAKPLAYVISHYAGQGTEGGEWGYGALQWLVPTLAAVVVTLAVMT